MNKPSNIKILDCTLRDGGYYNNWNFSKKILNNYIENINKSNIDIVEVGFRFLKKNKFGLFANSKEKFINTLPFKKNLKLGVMINSSDFSFKDDYIKQINRYFVKKKKSKISLIRLATHLKDVKKITPHIIYLKKLGYEIALNLMQIDKVKKNELIKVLNILNKTNSVNVFYFADSFGNLNSENVKKICKIISNNWSKEFGFHAHDNCGLALQNCITAINNGAKWIDSTIQGMGRGAGNVTTEDLLCHLPDKIKNKYNPKPIYHIAETDFKILKNKFKWGKSIYYHLSAKNNIHPSYIQQLLVDQRYNHNEIIDMIGELSKNKASGYNPIILRNLVSDKIILKKNWDAKDWCSKKNILILSQGNNLNLYKEKILKFIKKKKCKVLALNINTIFEKKYIDFYIASNESRALVDFKKYSKLRRKIILPLNRFNKILNKKLPKNIKNYGMVIKKNTFNYFGKYCEIPKNLVFGYALCISLIGNAKNIYLAGFDGFRNQKLLNKEMTDYFKFIAKKNPTLKLKSITPINYKIDKKYMLLNILK